MKGIIRYIIMIIPAALGVYGFLQIDGMSLSWALYYTLRLFFINTDLTNINIWIEVARWTAPVVTAGAFVLVIRSLRDKFVDRIKSFSKKSCTVYGDGAAAQTFLQNLGRHGIVGKDKIPKSKYQVILYEDDEKNLEFYNKNEKKLLGKKVYISLDNIKVNGIQKKGVTPFSMSENNAILYWNKYTVSDDENIAIIGNSSLNDELLIKGLLFNIYSTNQKINYHIFKSNNDFKHIHTELDKITMDNIYFYDSPWYEHFNLLENMNRIILCDKSEKLNLEILSKLSSLTISPKIYINIGSKDFIERFFCKDNIIPFGMLEELASREIIINEKLIEEAKEVHNQYVKNNGGEDWDNLNIFTRESNISAAYYKNVVKKLKNKNTNDEIIAELEHIRWCRLHYLNNWKYDKTKNKALRLHNDLVPYESLNDVEKQKDRENVVLATKN